MVEYTGALRNAYLNAKYSKGQIVKVGAFHNYPYGIVLEFRKKDSRGYIHLVRDIARIPYSVDPKTLPKVFFTS